MTAEATGASFWARSFSSLTLGAILRRCCERSRPKSAPSATMGGEQLGCPSREVALDAHGHHLRVARDLTPREVNDDVPGRRELGVAEAVELELITVETV